MNLFASHVLPNAHFWEAISDETPTKYLILLVGAPRFELGTPSPPDWCANRAALRSAECGEGLRSRGAPRKVAFDRGR